MSSGRFGALLTALLLVTASAAHAQVFGQYSGASTVPPNGHVLGAYLNASNNVVGLSAQLRLSFYPRLDFGFQGGLSRIRSDHSDRTVLRLATDLKGTVANASESLPVDLAVGGGVGVEAGDNYQVITLGPSVVASRTYAGAHPVTPFLGAALLFSNIDVASHSRTNVSLPLRLGAEWEMIPGALLTGELQVRIADDFNDDVAFSLGVNLPF